MEIEITLRDALRTQDLYFDGNWENYGVQITASNLYTIDSEDIFEEFTELLKQHNIETIQ